MWPWMSHCCITQTQSLNQDLTGMRATDEVEELQRRERGLGVGVDEPLLHNLNLKP